MNFSFKRTINSIIQRKILLFYCEQAKIIVSWFYKFV